MRVPSIPARIDRGASPDERSGAGVAAVDREPSTNPIVGYFQQLWWAEMPLATVFWRDMAVVGSIVNVVSIALATITAAFGGATGVGIALYTAPTPYNIFLVVAVWRRADRENTEWAWPARIGALVWLLLAFLV
jgi:hypothetical protein